MVMEDLGLAGGCDTEGYRHILKAVQGDLDELSAGSKQETVPNLASSGSRRPSEEARELLKNLAIRVGELRKSYVEKEAGRKVERAKAKKARDYEIFAEMPYKLSGRKFDLGERHPVSKKRFEAASEILEAQRTE